MRIIMYESGKFDLLKFENILGLNLIMQTVSTVICINFEVVLNSLFPSWWGRDIYEEGKSQSLVSRLQ